MPREGYLALQFKLHDAYFTKGKEIDSLQHEILVNMKGNRSLIKQFLGHCERILTISVLMDTWNMLNLLSRQIIYFLNITHLFIYTHVNNGIILHRHN